MKILGIDPGLRQTGYGVIETRAERGPPRLVEAGLVKTDADGPLEARLRELHDGLAEVLAEFRPDAAAVEQLYSHYKHPRTAILMGHARGVLFLALAKAGVPVASYGATRIKKSLVGAGHASKVQVQRAVAIALELSESPEPADVADALAAALCHVHTAARRKVRS